MQAKSTFSNTAVSVRPISGSDDGTLRFWDLEIGQSLRTLIGHSGVVMTVAMTPHGCHAISGSYDATLRLWDLVKGKACAR